MTASVLLPDMARHRRSYTPLADDYPSAVALALLALSPFLVLSTASQMLKQILMQDLHASMFGVQLSDGLANAGYAFGAVLAADLIQRVPIRSLFAMAEGLFVVASVVTLCAPDIVVFTIGRTLQGISTGELLVAALPPLVTKHGARRLPLTAVFVNLGLFGMVTIGPLVGGAAAATHGWRVLWGIVAAIGAIGFVLGRVAIERDADKQPRRPFDFSGPPIALIATVLPFLATSWLSMKGSGFTSVGFLVPLIIGVGALVWLIVRQYRKPDALMPLRMIAHTLPIVGIGAAMVTGATVTSGLGLAVLFLQKARGEAPVAIGLLLLTQVAGLLVAAWLFKRVLPSRWLPVFALTGLTVTAGGAAILLFLTRPNAAVLAPLSGLLLGFAAGAGVSPGLFMAGLSAPSGRLGPTFAFVELVRAEAAYLVAPILLTIAMGSTQLAAGVHLAAGIALAGCAAALIGLVILLLASGVHLQAPDLEKWTQGDEPAFESPPVAARLRSGRSDPSDQ